MAVAIQYDDPISEVANDAGLIGNIDVPIDRKETSLRAVARLAAGPSLARSQRASGDVVVSSVMLNPMTKAASHQVLLYKVMP